MAVIGAKKHTTKFKSGEFITLGTLTPDELAKYELEKDKCRFGSGKFDSRRYDALVKKVVTKKMLDWGGFERLKPGTEDQGEPWPYAPDQVDAFMAAPDTTKFWQATFSDMMIAQVAKDETDDKPIEDKDPDF